MALPPYESIYPQDGDFGALIGPYLDLPSLRNLVVVDTQTYAAFSPLLWNDPIRWIINTPRPFSNIVRFMEIAKRCRKATRDLVFSFDLRGLQALSNDSIHRQDFHRFETIISYEWLTRHQTMFANLRFLVIDGLRMGEEAGFEDESSRSSQPRELFAPLLLSYRGIHIDGSKILEPSTSEKVMYLDLSGTFRPDQWTRAMQEANFRNLRIIKLCGMRLTDRMFPYNLLVHNSLKLWSLDLRDNVLSDDFIALILRQTGIAAYDASLHPMEKSILNGEDEELYDGVPLYTRDDGDNLRPPFNILVPMRADTLEAFTQYLRSNCNMATDPRYALPRDDIYVRHTGLTHLYLANNKLTSNVIHELFKFENNRLQSLDLGSLQVPLKDLAAMNYSRLRFQSCVSFAVVNSAKYFNRKAGNRIEKLRIHHSFITLVPTVVQNTLKQGYRLDHLKKAEHVSEREPGLWGEAFRPQDNYRLRELVLTDIPTKSYGSIINRLITFLKLCHEQEIVLEQARERPAQQHYRAPLLLSGLRVLKLEFLHPRLEPIDTRLSSVSNQNSISASGDMDVDNFLSNSAGDFSFFSSAPERPVAMRARSLPQSIEGTDRKVRAVRLEKAIVGRGISREAHGYRSSATDGCEGEMYANEAHRAQNEMFSNKHPNTRGELNSKQEMAMLPKDVIEELRGFRMLRPRWSGKLIVVRPKISAEEEGEGLMGWN